MGDPVEVTPLPEAVGKVRAAKDGLGDDALLIARTDAVGDEALKRAEAYVAAGADLIMPVSKTFSSLEGWQRCHELTGVPLVASLTAWTWVEREFTDEAMQQAGIKVAMVATHGIPRRPPPSATPSPASPRASRSPTCPAATWRTRTSST